ncbi:MAG: class I adenylate-forming enzyme family protein [Devosia sp.]|nr:class I adenylate-forming enzyme family protein [Devosia sp.]
MQLAKSIIYRARSREDEPAIALTTGVATYGMLARAIESVVGRLAALDLPHGSVVVLDVKNPFHHMAILIGLALSGLASASIQSRQHLLQTRVAPAAVLTDSQDFVLDGSRVFVVDEGWFLIDPARPVDYARLFALPGFERPEEVVRVTFSSGTTGFPKAVALTLEAAERRMLNAAVLRGGAGAIELRALNLMGFSTLMGFGTPFSTLGSGGIIAFAPDVTNAIHLIRLFRIEFLTATPLQLNAMLKALEGKPPLTSLTLVATGGSKLPPRMVTRIRDKLGPYITFAYGSTEAGMMSAAGAATLDVFPGSAGYLLPWVEMQVVDPTGKPMPGEEDGIIRVKTSEVARYLSETPDTTEMFRDGWFYPGDVGHLTADGIVYVTGRSDEVINRGGQIIAPEIIEETLLGYPGIKDAAVFGHPNAEGIEDIWAAVVSDQWVDAAAVKQVIFSRMPDRFPDHVVQIEAIPRNEMGKVRRKELRERLAKAN